MSYSPGCLNDVMKRIEKSLGSAVSPFKCKKLSDVKESALMIPDVHKKDFAGVILNLVEVLDFIQNFLPSAGTKWKSFNRN